MSSKHPLTPAQKQALTHQGSACLLGGVGTGKTMLLVEKAARLIEQGLAKKGEVFFGGLSMRATLVAREKLVERLGSKADLIELGTLRDFAYRATENIQLGEKKQPKLADYASVRRCLRQAMHETGFEGTIDDAEHVLRAFLSRPKKPAETEPYVSLLKVYRDFMTQMGLTDRNDTIRNHILAMRSTTEGQKAPPLPMKYLFVDSAQDLGRLQLLWLIDHLKAGSIITLAADPAQCLQELDGALGLQALMEFSAQPNVEKITLSESFRPCEPIAERLVKVVMPASLQGEGGQLQGEWMPIAFQEKTAGEVRKESFKTGGEEAQFIVSQVRSMLSHNPALRIGVITKTDKQAIKVERLVEKAGMPHGSFALGFWEMPGAIAVLDFLMLLMNTAEERHLRGVLLGLGTPPEAVRAVLKAGVTAKGWLHLGAPLPEGVALPPAHQQSLKAAREKLKSFYALMLGKQATPQDVFKAGVAALLERMTPEEQENALLAVDALLDVRGSLAEAVPRLCRPRRPDVTANLIISPIREVPNMEFDVVFMPFWSQPGKGWAPETSRILGKREGHERRLFYTAASRCRTLCVVTCAEKESAIVANI